MRARCELREEHAVAHERVQRIVRRARRAALVGGTGAEDIRRVAEPFKKGVVVANAGQVEAVGRVRRQHQRRCQREMQPHPVAVQRTGRRRRPAFGTGGGIGFRRQHETSRARLRRTRDAQSQSAAAGHLPPSAVAARGVGVGGVGGVAGVSDPDVGQEIATIAGTRGESLAQAGAIMRHVGIAVIGWAVRGGRAAGGIDIVHVHVGSG